MRYNAGFVKKSASIFLLTVFTWILIGCENQSRQNKESNAQRLIARQESLANSGTDMEAGFIQKKRLEKIEQQRQLAKQQQMREAVHADSLWHDAILQKALRIAKQNINNPTFSRTFETPDTAHGDVTTKLIMGNFFSKTRKHLLIRRKTPQDIYLNLFTVSGSRITPVLTHVQWRMEYTNDTINDLNGDGYKDFIVNWYGSSGCCLKAFSEVYLYKPGKDRFTGGFEFINPTFSSKEKTIRGVCYGHPGETEMYKYKWNGEKVDTIEYVFYEKNEEGEKTSRVICSNQRPYHGNFQTLKRLTSVPKEYTKIKGYDWFTGEGF